MAKAERVKDLQAKLTDGTMSVRAVEGTAAELRKGWNKFSVERKHDILAALIKEVQIGPAIQPWSKFRPERITIEWW